MKKTNKLLAAVLSLMMLFQSAPIAAFAESPDSTSEIKQIGVIDDKGQDDADIETDEIVKPLLDSIAIQQGIDLNNVGVIIVNDGSKDDSILKLIASYELEPTSFFVQGNIIFFNVRRNNTSKCQLGQWV